MNWLINLPSDHALYPVLDECLEYSMESYYLIFDRPPEDREQE